MSLIIYGTGGKVQGVGCGKLSITPSASSMCTAWDGCVIPPAGCTESYCSYCMCNHKHNFIGCLEFSGCVCTNVLCSYYTCSPCWKASYFCKGYMCGTVPLAVCVSRGYNTVASNSMPSDGGVNNLFCYGILGGP